jgi:hypothetical protein
MLIPLLWCTLIFLVPRGLIFLVLRTLILLVLRALARLLRAVLPGALALRSGAVTT